MKGCAAMTLRNVLLWSLCSMTLACTTVYAVLPPSELPAESQSSAPAEAASVEVATTIEPAAEEPAGEQTLEVDLRVGHDALRQSGDRKTYALLEVRAGSELQVSDVRSVTTLVIDRSGSMDGIKIRHARAAGGEWFERAADGDIVGMLTFNEGAEWIVRPTVMDAQKRRGLLTQLAQTIAAGGGTCLSCGVEDAQRELADAGASTVRRLVVLSDGQANAGIVQPSGYRHITRYCRERGIAITTVGLGTDYNEKLLTRLAFETNGRHYFVEKSEDLAAVFDSEARAVRQTAVTSVEARIELGPGVELVDLYDRSYRREGGRLLVSLGTLNAGESSTVLLELRAPAALGRHELASFELSATDPRAERVERHRRRATVAVHTRTQSELDPLVAMRLERSATARALWEASDLFNAGQRDQALGVLAAHQASLRSAAQRLGARAEQRGDARAADIRADLLRQIADTSQSRQSFESASPSLESGRRAVRATGYKASPYGR